MSLKIAKMITPKHVGTLSRFDLPHLFQNFKNYSQISSRDFSQSSFWSFSKLFWKFFRCFCQGFCISWNCLAITPGFFLRLLEFSNNSKLNSRFIKELFLLFYKNFLSKFLSYFFTELSLRLKKKSA